MRATLPPHSEIAARIAAAPDWRDARRARAAMADRRIESGARHPGPLIPAAVLVPLVLHADGPTVLLTRRTDHLHDHAGQISFPGGRIESTDASPEAAALRETVEEIGIAPDRIQLIGRLDTYVVRTGFEITPAVGFVQPPFALDPDPFEVAEVFEVPLAFVLDRRNHQAHSRVFNGVERWFHVLQHGDHYIWGATAAMLVNLADVLDGP